MECQIERRKVRKLRGRKNIFEKIGVTVNQFHRFGEKNIQITKE